MQRGKSFGILLQRKNVLLIVGSLLKL